MAAAGLKGSMAKNADVSKK